jgi:hypothetical protein
LKKIAYYTELYEWTGLKKMYANIISQIENGLADWSKDFICSVWRKQKKSQRKKNLFFIVLIFREKNAHMLIHIMVNFYYVRTRLFAG